MSDKNGDLAKQVRALGVLKAELSGLAKDWVWAGGKEQIPGCLLGVGPEGWRQNDASRCVTGGQNRPGKYRPDDHSRHVGRLGRQVQVPQAHTAPLYICHNILTKLSPSFPLQPLNDRELTTQPRSGFSATNISFQ